MKQINTFSGKKFFVEDDKVNAIIAAMEQESKVVLKVRGGVLMASAIESITDVDTKPYFMGRLMNKDETRVLTDTGWKQFTGDRKKITYRPIAVGRSKQISPGA